MSLSTRIYKQNIQNTEITFVDFSNVNLEEHVLLLEKVDILLTKNTSIIYFLMDGKKADFNIETIKFWKKIISKHDLVQYRAGIYGLDTIRRLAVWFTNLTNPHSVCGFKDKKDAVNHLLKNVL